MLTRLGATVPRVRDQVLELLNQDRLRRGEAVTPPGIRDYDIRIELARQAKDAAVDAKDLGRPRPPGRARRNCWPSGTA